MVLPQALRLLFPTQDARDSPDGNSKCVLQQQQGTGNDAEVAVQRVEVRVVVDVLVCFDYGDPGHEG